MSALACPHRTARDRAGGTLVYETATAEANLASVPHVRPDLNPIAPAMVEGARLVGVPTFENHNGRMM